MKSKDTDDYSLNPPAKIITNSCRSTIGPLATTHCSSSTWPPCSCGSSTWSVWCSSSATGADACSSSCQCCRASRPTPGLQSMNFRYVGELWSSNDLQRFLISSRKPIGWNSTRGPCSRPCRTCSASDTEGMTESRPCPFVLLSLFRFRTRRSSPTSLRSLTLHSPSTQEKFFDYFIQPKRAALRS